MAEPFTDFWKNRYATKRAESTERDELKDAIALLEREGIT